MINRSINLVAYYHTTPKDPNRTKEAGYMSDPENTVMNESINITRGLKMRDQVSAQIILDMTRELVVKNTFNENRDYAGLLAYFQEGYPQYINPVLAQLYPEVHDESNVQSVQTETKTEGQS